MHRLGKDWNGQPCLDDAGSPRLKPPCAAYVEIMVPVFSRYAWRCAWSMIQNDLTHGWGLDLTWHVCAADEKKNRTAVDGMGVVDAQGVRHLGAPTLGEQGEATVTVSGMQAVSRRRAAEWDLYNARWRTPDLVARYLARPEDDETRGTLPPTPPSPPPPTTTPTPPREKAHQGGGYDGSATERGVGEDLVDKQQLQRQKDSSAWTDAVENFRVGDVDADDRGMVHDS